MNAATNNGKGIASLAPTATILPIRLKQWTKYHGVAPSDKIYISVNSDVKAVRALRFEFEHGHFEHQVRVVNMSFSYPAMFRNIPYPNPAAADMKLNITRDLKKNDRLYVAAAGNDMTQSYQYPAAHDNVLGVTGVKYTHGNAPDSRYIYHTGSNYLTNNTYPVSGVWQCVNSNGEERANTAITPLDHPNYFLQTFSTSYGQFRGTSAAAPQVAALAYHLYQRRRLLIEMLCSSI